MKINATETKELILAESAILQALSNLQREHEQTRDVHLKQAKEIQIQAITDYVSQVREFIYLNRLRLANMQVMLQVYKQMEKNSNDFEKIMAEKYEHLASKNR